jgi:hypothetical protein
MTEPHRHRQSGRSAERLDLLRRLRKHLPGPHSFAENDAALARARVRRLDPMPERFGLAFWGFFAKRPALYRVAMRAAMRVLAIFGGEDGRFGALPLAKD